MNINKLNNFEMAFRYKPVFTSEKLISVYIQLSLDFQLLVRRRLFRICLYFALKLFSC